MHTSPQTDRQNSGFTYDATRLLRNAAMLGPSDTANITQMHGGCTAMMKRPYRR